MKTYNSLYELRKDGKYQIWHMEQNGSQIRSVSAIYDLVNKIPVDTSIVTSTWKEIFPTNVGKVNERNPEQQAEFEILKHYRMRREAGAIENIGDKPFVANKIAPMLAQKYKTQEIKFPVYSQAKLDGGRAIVTKEGMFSRNWKPIISAPHIHNDLEQLLELGYKFDGELYNHAMKHDFEKIMSLVRKSKPTDQDIIDSRNLVQYWIFDLILDDTSFVDRMNILKSLNLPESCVLVDTTECNSFDEIDNVYADYLADGYEGQMIRRDAVYEYTRTKSLTKRKEFIDDEFTITALEEGQGNWAGAIKVIHCIDKRGKPFRATLKGTYENGVILMDEKDEYIGGEAMVRYQNLTTVNKDTGEGGIPRFPVAVAIFKGKRDI